MGCSTIRRYVFLVWILIELLCFGGIIHGWGALVFVLKEEGIYAELCEGNHTNSSLECSERDERFNLYFAISTSAGYILLCLTSRLFAKLGTRKTRPIISLCFAAGCLMMAMADNDSPWLICVGGVFLTGCGISFLITTIQVNVLFPKHSSTVVGLIEGTYDSSAVVPLVIKKMYSSGISRQISFLILMGLSSMTVVSTFLFFPKTLLEKKRELDQEKIQTLSNDVHEEFNLNSPSITSPIETFNDKQDSIVNSSDTYLHVKTDGANHGGTAETLACKAKQHERVETSDIRLAIQNNDTILETSIKESVITTKDSTILPKSKGQIETSSAAVNEQDLKSDIVSTKCTKGDHQNQVVNGKPKLKGLRENVLNIVYFTNVVWCSILQLRTGYFVGTINPVIVKLTHRNEESVSYFTDILSYTMFCGCVSSFGCGYLYDYQKSFFKHILHARRRTYISSIIPLSLASVLASILSGIMFVQNENILYVAPIILTLFRSVLWTVAAAFLVDVFPSSHFGQLYAIRMFVANVFSLLQYALFRWSNAYSNGQLHVNIMLSVLCCVSFLHPLSVFVKAKSVR